MPKEKALELLLMLRLEKSKLYIYFFGLDFIFFSSTLVYCPFDVIFQKKIYIVFSDNWCSGLLFVYQVDPFAATVTMIKISKIFGHLF